MFYIATYKSIKKTSFQRKIFLAVAVLYIFTVTFNINY